MKKLTCGIYKITNLINDKSYIGQSIHIEQRWKDHIKEAFKKDSDKYNYPLYQAIRKYGLENFKFEILEECLEEDLNQKEIYYISLYDSYTPAHNKGYNQNPGGSGGTPYKNKKYKDKEILNKIKYYLISSDLTQKEIARLLNICESTVSHVNKGKVAFDKNLKYPIRYYNSTSNLNYNKFKNSLNKRKGKICPICGAKIQNYSNKCRKCSRLDIKIQIPSKEEILKAFYELKNCQKVADKFNVSTMLLKKWRKELQLPEKVKDTIELYEREYLGIMKEEKPKRQIRKVLQISLKTGEILREFDNCHEAEKFLSIKNGGGVNNCCLGKIKTSYGYRWKYKE